MPVKFVDLNPIHSFLKPKINEVIQAVIESNEYVGGKYIDRFESNFATYLQARHCVTCGNGTDALELALWSLGIKSGDEIIVPEHSWISTASAVETLGARPVFVPCNPEDYTIDVSQITKSITQKTKAIIAVHLYGHPADMQSINEIARIHDLKVIEDAAQAHGAEYHGQKCGTLSDIGCFSFYPSKNLGCLGDGGCIVTNDDDIADRIKTYKNCGQKTKNKHLYSGRNSRMDNIQAAVLNLKLPYLDKWNDERRANAALYTSLLDHTKYALPIVRPYARHVYHIYCIQTSMRAEVIKRLEAAGIEYGIHYPSLLSNLPILNSKKHISMTDYSGRIISLPLYLGIPLEALHEVIKALND